MRGTTQALEPLRNLPPQLPWVGCHLSPLMSDSR